MDTSKRGYLIIESALNEMDPVILSEEQNTIRFKAQLQEAEMPNRNRRIYSKDAIDNAIKHYSVQEKMKYKAFYGRVLPFNIVIYCRNLLNCWELLKLN